MGYKSMLNKTYMNKDLSMVDHIFYILTDVKGLEITRTAKLLSLVVAHMVDSGKLTEKEMNNLLQIVETLPE